MKRELQKLNKQRYKRQMQRWKLKIQNDLNNYIFLAKEILEKESQILGAKAQVIDDMPRGSNENNSNTEKQALKLMRDVSDLMSTKESIERAMGKMQQNMKGYFEMRYVKEYSRHKTCREIYLSERQYFRMNDKIIGMVGKEMGLIE